VFVNSIGKKAEDVATNSAANVRSFFNQDPFSQVMIV